MKRLLYAVLLIAATLVSSDAAHAESLKIAPHSYEATIQKSEVKKGYIDVSNPDNTSVRIKLETQAFRQTDDQGSLEFFDSEQLSNGVKLDFQTLTLGPREAYRVYFLLDGSKLPEGDVFGAIFASTVPTTGAGTRQSTRVGTLLMLQNGTPTSRKADISSFATSFLHVGDGLSAKVAIHNPADPKKATGFIPNLTISTAPYGSKNVKGPLIFAGRTRTIDYVQTGNYFGPMWFAATSGESSKGRLILAITGYWQWLAPVLLTLLVVLGLSVRRIFGKKRRI
jgi:hypothetical protein